MAWNGVGSFSRSYSWATDAANGVDIDATRMDADTDDIVAGLNNALCKDGQNAPSAHLPMGGYRHTGVADGTARTHYASVGQAQDGSSTYCVAGGTADALTLAFSPVITALVDGQRFRVKASATNTGAATAAVNGIAAKSIKRPNGNALAAGDITNGQVYDLQYVQSSDALVLVNAIPTASQVGALSSTGSNTAGGNLDMDGHSSFNDALKAATATSNTGVTPNTLTIDFKTGDKAAFTAAANVKLIPQFPTDGGIGFLDLTNGGAYTITFQAGAKYVGGSAPTFTTSGLDRVWFMGTDSNYTVTVQKGIA